MTRWRVHALLSSCLLLGLFTGCPDPQSDNNSSNASTTNASSGNQPPIADPGANVDAVVGQRVEVSAANSSDPEGDILTVSWTLEPPEGSQATLEDDTSFRAAFTPDIVGLYKLVLVVNDGLNDSEPVPVYVRVTKGQGGGNNTTTPDNEPPVANAGEDPTLFIDQEIVLDGSASSDPDGDALTYQWSMIQSPPGSSAMLSDNSAQKPILQADLPGIYEFQLVVNDGELDSMPDQILVNVRDTTPSNSPPVAAVDNAPTTVVIGQEARFDGSASSDPDGDPITFGWMLVTRPSGSQAELASMTSATTTLTPDVAGVYEIELVVSDREEMSAPLTLQLTATEIQNTAPVAMANVPSFAFPGQRVELDGSASSDADGDPLTYRWRLLRKPAGSPVLLEQATSARAAITPDLVGEYEVELVVSDPFESSAPQTFVIQVADRPDTCLIISEYIEGSGNNKAIELYNCDDKTIDLTGRYVCLIRDGSTDCTSPLALQGMLGAGDVIGICNSQFNMSAIDAGDCALTGGAMSFNGDDRVVVFEDLDSDGQFDENKDAILDAFGEVLSTPSSRVWEDVTYRRCNLMPYDGYTPFDADAFYDDFFNNDFSDFGIPPQPGVMCGAAPVNRAPVANAGPSRNVTTGQTITLSAAQSSDPDNDPLTYQWSLVQAPMNSVAMLDDATSETPSFVADLDGVYSFELVVSDGSLTSMTATVTITALPPVMPGMGCLLISEYIEGSSSNKAIELLNCDTDPVSLDDINLCLVTNNSTTCSTTEQLSGQLLAGEVFGLCNGSLNMSLVDAGDCDLNSSVTNFNGNDRIVLYRDLDASGDLDVTQDEVLDMFGDPATPPASEIWKDKSYRRCNLAMSYLGVGPFVVEDYYSPAMTVDDFTDFGVAPQSGATCP